MWFGNENETMLNFYLRKVSGEKYEPYDYYQDQVESIDATEYVKIV